MTDKPPASATERPAPPTSQAAKAEAPPMRRGMAALATLVTRIARPMLRQHGLADTRLVTEWATVAGADLAELSMPERLVRGRDGAGGTLHVRVAGAAALDFQYRADLVVERINRFFGYKAVARLRLVQGPLPRRPETPAPAPLAPEDQAAIDRAVSAVADPDLRASLARFGRALKSRESERRSGPGPAVVHK
jgi:hypothetical protein